MKLKEAVLFPCRSCDADKTRLTVNVYCLWVNSRVSAMLCFAISRGCSLSIQQQT